MKLPKAIWFGFSCIAIVVMFVAGAGHIVG